MCRPASIRGRRAHQKMRAAIKRHICPFEPFTGLNPADIVSTTCIGCGLDGNVPVAMVICHAVAAIGSTKGIATFRFELQVTQKWILAVLAQSLEALVGEVVISLTV